MSSVKWSPEEFALHDVSAFPIVRPRTNGLPPGFAKDWAVEMNRLLQRGSSFVFLVDEPHGEEGHEDRKVKTQWIKANKSAFAALCLGFVMIEPDPVKRLAMRAQGAVLAKTFGLKFHVVADVRKADLRARELVAGTTPANADD